MNTELQKSAPELTVEAIPTLTLEPFAPEPEAPVKEIVPATVEDTALTPAEAAQVAEFAQKIDLNNSNMVLTYGAAAQEKIASFSETALEKVRTKELGEVGNMIGSLVVELKGFSVDEEERGGFFGLFKKVGNSIASLQARYEKAEVNVEKIVSVLEGHQVQLLKDVAMLDKMYALNLTYFKELSMYILAGKQKLAQVRAKDLPAATEKAKASGLPEDAQAANDLANLCDRFEKKLHDLELTRVISIQMAPQIRLVQANDTLMTEKIQSTLVNTIPLWKSQMVLALGVAHSREAMEAQRAVTDVTNDLLRKNAETLKTGTIETAKESERGIVDLATLQYTNEQLITTLDEVLKIQTEGHAKRQAAEAELGKIEGELKEKLLELRS